MTKKYNSTRFKVIILQKIADKGYPSIRKFAQVNNLPRNPLTRALSGENVPSRETLNRWCEILECSSQERKEIFQAVYVPEDEETSVAA